MDFHIVKMIKCKLFIYIYINRSKILQVIGSPTEE